LLIVLTFCDVRRKPMHLRLVYLWSTRAKQAMIMRIPSHRLPRRAAYFADGTTLGSRS
jgi:hypothetical protein